MQQFRLDSASAFHCFRCGEDKKAKLVTVHKGDWNKLLCNGCYGRLLSIHEIKAGTAPDDGRAEALANVLLSLVSKDTQDAGMTHLRVSERRADHLSERALRFLATSEAVSKSLTAEPGLDWSPAVIGLCKAVECEVQARLLVPLKSLLGGKALDTELKNKYLRRVAIFCSEPSAHPPELGPVRYFLREVAGQDASAAGGLVTAFRRLILDWPGSDWLFAADGLPASLETLSGRFRNPAAHADELGPDAYAECRSLIIGDKGILWRLVISTKAIK
jgi:hypothetical protein